MSKIGAFLRKLLPSFLIGREKAVAAFLAPIIVSELLHLLPNVDVDPSWVEQLVLAVITSITVHQTTNTP